MKAFCVWDEVGGDQAVVTFADKAVVARREGAAQMDREFSEVSCRRAPEYDQYAEVGRVPKAVQLASGWWFSCDAKGCFERVSGEDAVVVDESVYCGPTCANQPD